MSERVDGRWRVPTRRAERLLEVGLLIARLGHAATTFAYDTVRHRRDGAASWRIFDHWWQVQANERARNVVPRLCTDLSTDFLSNHERAAERHASECARPSPEGYA